MIFHSLRLGEGGRSLLRLARTGLFVWCAAMLGGCAGPDRRAPGTERTLATNPRLPGADIATFFSPAEWRKLRSLDYLGYVVFDATIRADGTVNVGNVIEHYPDASWDGLAGSFTPEVRLRAAGAGSWLGRRAEVCVIFFRPGVDGRLALIFARQTEVPEAGNGPQRAMYLHTEHYELPAGVSGP